MAVTDKQVFQSELVKTSAYVQHSYFTNEAKQKIQWFTVYFRDNQTLRIFQKHEVHVPQNVKIGDLEDVESSVINYVETVQAVYEKY
jgi:hypothetical protein